MSKKNDLPSMFMESFLMEYVCTGCMESIYRPFMLVSKSSELEYPDIDFLEEQIQQSGMHPGKHMSKMPGSGFYVCGEYRACRVWRLWENPDRYKEVVDQTARMSKDPRVQKLHQKVVKEKTHEEHKAIERSFDS